MASATTDVATYTTYVGFPTTRRTPDYDVVCIGFGTKGLALATAFADQDPRQKVLFLERGIQFSETLGYGSQENACGSGFLRDLITLRNPRSEYTFINFLHSTELLVAFTNASQMSTSRLLTAKYLSWVAEKISSLGWLSFGREAINIRPTELTPNGRVTGWTVDLRDSANGAASRVSCKRLIVATGAPSRLPDQLASPKLSSVIVPLHNSAGLVDRVQHSRKPLHIAIVGADQEAVELFEHLLSAPGQHHVSMVVAASALRCDDVTPFAQEIVDGAGSTPAHLPPEIRQRHLATSVAAVSPTVDLETLERVYQALYIQRIQQPDKTRQRFKMRPYTEISRAQLEQGKVQLTARDTRAGEESPLPDLFDLIVTATERDSIPSKPLLAPLLSMFDGTFQVDAYHQINFRKGSLAPGCGLWALGTLAHKHHRRDDFTAMAETAGRILDSISGVAEREGDAMQGEQEMAML